MEPSRLDHVSLAMPQHLSEDDIYRTSSQYRFWSFSPERLNLLRKKTHDLAVERARRHAGQHNGDVAIGTTSNGEEMDRLTEDEEMRLVQRYCDQIRTTSDHFKWPINVKVRSSRPDHCSSYG